MDPVTQERQERLETLETLLDEAREEAERLVSEALDADEAVTRARLAATKALALREIADERAEIAVERNHALQAAVTSYKLLAGAKWSFRMEETDDPESMAYV